MVPADALHGLLRLPGATYACVVERDSGRVLAEVGRGEGGAGDGEGVVPYSVARWGTAVAAMFDATSGDELDDVMITGRRSYHLVRSIDVSPSVLAYLRLDRSRSNLAAARRELAAVRWGADEPPRASPPPLSFPSRRAPASAPPAAEVAAAGGAPPATRREPARVPAALPPTPPPAARDAERKVVSAAPARDEADDGGPRIPLPRRTAAPPTADAPRRTAVSPMPVEVSAVPSGFAMPGVLGQRWARDPSTLRRLLAGLRRMS